MAKINIKKKLQDLINGLEIAYDNMITILNEDVERNEKTGKIKLKDSQLKVYSEGISKASETADKLLTQIQTRQTELDGLNKPKSKSNINKNTFEEVEEIEEVDISDDFPLEQHLQ